MANLKEIRTQRAEQRDMTTFTQSSFWHHKDAEVSFLFVNYDHKLTHLHKDFCEIFCVISGEITNVVNGKKALLKGGDCCLILRDDTHSLYLKEESKKDFLGINFVMRYDYFTKLKYLFGEENAKIFESEETKLFHLEEDAKSSLLNKTYLLQTTNREYDTEKEFNCKCIIIDLLKRLVATKLKFDKKRDVPDWLNMLLMNMQKTENAGKSLEDFVSAVPYSYSYVAREFKKYVGCSMVNYLTISKIRYAETLLLNTNKKMLEISSELGYSSLSHFNHIFKKMYGISPTQFRKEKGIVVHKEYVIRRKSK